MFPRSLIFALLSVLYVNSTPLTPENKEVPQVSTIYNEVSSDDDPSSALSGVYSECLIKISFPCVQRKTLLFIDRLSRLDRIPIVGDFVSIVKISQQKSPAIVLDESPLDRDEATLRALIDLSIDRFFQTHVVRLQIPPLFPEETSSDEEGKGKSASDDTVVDFTIGDSIQAEGRKKGGGGGGKMKGMKKMMMLMGMMMMTKLIMIAPILMGVMGLAAIKAIIFSVASITISKIMLLKKLKAMMGNKGGHGGGHDSGGSGGWSSGSGGSSGGGWDRSLDDSHPLAYRGYVS